jgi:hypothetical protein
MEAPILPITDEQVLKTLDAAIEKRRDSGHRAAYRAFILAALGSLGWVG